jgi:protein-S-isoprenylcysteine O-methyltransferase Ste14
VKRALRYLWRHPRRTGFIIFNLVVVAILFGWAQITASMSQQGIAGVPNVMLGYTGMALLLAALIAGWIAWAVMVTSRHAHLPSDPPKDRTVG